MYSSCMEHIISNLESGVYVCWHVSASDCIFIYILYWLWLCVLFGVLKWKWIMIEWSEHMQPNYVSMNYSEILLKSNFNSKCNPPPIEYALKNIHPFFYNAQYTVIQIKFINWFGNIAKISNRIQPNKQQSNSLKT